MTYPQTEMASANTALSDLYQEVILDHSRRPRFKSKPVGGCQFCQEGKNPLCGDQITLFCAVKQENTSVPLVSFFFEGHGCSISQASASMLCESVHEVPVLEARRVLSQAEATYTGKAALPNAEDFDNDIDALYGVSKFPVRVKCAALPWKTMEILLNEKFDEMGKLKADQALCSSLTPSSCAREKRVLRIVSTED
jgi:nitrogen fixation protein NifU and related proteins